MNYADVAVNSPIAQKNSFCYSIPPYLNISTGDAVWVPFGSKTMQGIVLGISDVPAVESVKEIAGLISSDLILTPARISLAKWISEYYFCPLFDAISLMLPPSFDRRMLTVFRKTPELSNLVTEDKDIQAILVLFQGREEIEIKQFEKILGKKKARLLLTRLETEKLLIKFNKLEREKVKPKVVSYVKLEIDKAQVNALLIGLKQKRSHKKAALIELLSLNRNPISLSDIRKKLSCSREIIDSLLGQGVISLGHIEVRRDPLANLDVTLQSPKVLTDSQNEACGKLKEIIISGFEDSKASVVLLKGVTGSGKTELYLQALAEVIARGKRGICLVPEIALTPQTIERFVARFPGEVAVFHSGLTAGEQYDEWNRIRQGECDVVIGPRSALFVPQPDLGLIIIDEEHEWTYKQADSSPRYHARDVAIKLAQLVGATVILGSATPDMVTYYKSTRGNYQMITLPERITPRGIVVLPEVEIVDMSNELKSGNTRIFSRPLLKAIEETWQKKEQTLLFLNRRGSATMVQCLECNYIYKCNRCQTVLVYHESSKKLMCHHCNYSLNLPGNCRQCNSNRIELFGTGTERVETELKELFPGIRILRWDKDVTGKRGAHQEILTKFLAHEADLLIGTQMVSKGLDLPAVTLAGVINADTSLSIPDFRSNERTFQLLCQIAGRAGRGLAAGKVIIQTFSPDHNAIQTAAKHDYIAFYNWELKYRQQFGYPPFSRLVRLVYNNTNQLACRSEAEKMAKTLITEKYRKDLPDVRLIGPLPSFPSRVRGKYQWQIVICARNPNEVVADIAFPRGWIIDVDSIGTV